MNDTYKDIDDYIKRCNELILEIKLNQSKDMENEAIKRIELAEKELKAAKEALQQTVTYFYRELLSNSPHYNTKGNNIYPIYMVWDRDFSDKCVCYDIDSSINNDSQRYVTDEDSKPSTKEAFDKQNEIIRVPDCIKFGTNRTKLGIMFNDGQQCLYFQDDVYQVMRTYAENSFDGSNFKLTECDRSDLKAGDVAFSTLDIEPEFNDIEDYNIILNETDIAYVDDVTDITVIGLNSLYSWYKVEKI